MTSVEYLCPREGVESPTDKLRQLLVQASDKQVHITHLASGSGRCSCGAAIPLRTGLFWTRKSVTQLSTPGKCSADKVIPLPKHHVHSWVARLFNWGGASPPMWFISDTAVWLYLTLGGCGNCPRSRREPLLQT